MKSLNIVELEKLRNEKSYPALSIFMPMHKAVPARLQDPIKLKDLVKKALEQVDTAKASPKDLESLASSLDRIAEEIDYTKASEGLAIFVNKTSAQAYALSFPIQERVVVSDSFAVAELEGTLNRIPRYWVLALSSKPTRLFKGFGPSLEEIHDAQTISQEPQVLHGPQIERKEEGFPFELDYQVTNDSKVMAVELGQKDAKYFTELEKQFYHKVDELLGKHLKEHAWPVIVLGTESALGNFEKITHHKEAIVVSHKGDYPHASMHDIAVVVWPLVEKYINQIANAAFNYFKEEAIGSGHYAMGLQNVWHMAQEGRVRMLLVEKEHVILGLVDPDNQDHLLLSDTSVSDSGVVENLVDRVVATVFAKGGKVFFLPYKSLHDYEHIAAVLRY